MPNWSFSLRKLEHAREANIVTAVAAVVVVAAMGYLFFSSRAATGSGLNWPSGVHAGDNLTDDQDFANWRGRGLDVTTAYTNPNGGWNALTNPSDLFDANGFQDFTGTLVISQPLFPTGGTMADCASGAYDTNWRAFGSFLGSHSRNTVNTVVRIGWDFNTPNRGWRPVVPPSPDASQIATGLTQFKQCWQKVSTAIKATAPNVKADWTIKAHGSAALGAGGVAVGYNPYDAYPGDQYVDIIGTDAYDGDAVTASGSQSSSVNDADFTAQCNRPEGYGACDIAQFARTHSKKFSVGEWAVYGACATAVANGGAVADNAFYVTKMASFFNQNKDILAYEAYYDDPVVRMCTALNRGNGGGAPNAQAAAAYLANFGANSPYATGGGGGPTPVSIPFRMNVGGAAYTDSDNKTWAADQYATGGANDTSGAGKTITNSGNDQAIYQDERTGMSSYAIPVPNGTYTLALHFAELNTGCAIGCRVFNVTAEGQAVLTNFDVVKTAGAALKANVQVFTVTVSDGTLNIGFNASAGAAALNGLQILAPGTDPGGSGGGPVGSGLNALYWSYNADGSVQNTVRRIDQTVNFDWTTGTPDAAITADNFGVRWVGQIVAPTSGAYTFYATADDGEVVTINGQTVINDFSLHGAREASGTITLTAGQAYDIMIMYKEAGFSASMNLSWSGPSLAKQIVPASALKPTVKNGLSAFYYTLNSTGDISSVVSDISPTINYDWSTGSPHAGVPVDNFFVAWTGQIQAPVTGTYTFTTTTDDGNVLWVGNKRVIDDEVGHPPTDKTGTIDLVAGQKYNIRMFYFEGVGGASAKLQWSAPGLPQAIIPTANLFDN